MSNLALLKKGDLQLSDLTTNGGILQPSQAAEFIRHLIDASVLLQEVLVVPMRSDTHLVEGIRFDTRIARPGVVSQALPESDRSKPTTTKATLNAKLIKAQVNLPEEVLEDNIEQGTLRQTAMQMMEERLALDLEELHVNGDTASADAYLALLDGMLKSATSYVVDAGTAYPTDLLWKEMLKKIPSAALRAKSMMKFLTSVDAETEYYDHLAQRGDSLGAMIHQDSSQPLAPRTSYSGINVQPVPVFPENLGVGTNETNALLCWPKNWAAGIKRQITIATDYDVEAGELIMVASCRVDGKWIYEPHTVKATKVRVS